MPITPLSFVNKLPPTVEVGVVRKLSGLAIKFGNTVKVIVAFEQYVVLQTA